MFDLACQVGDRVGVGVGERLAEPPCARPLQRRDEAERVARRFGGASRVEVRFEPSKVDVDVRGETDEVAVRAQRVACTERGADLRERDP